jgi:hypothetical protein
MNVFTMNNNLSGFQTYNGLPELPDFLNFDPVREKQMRNGLEVPGKYWVINPLTDTVIGDGKTVHNPQNFNKMWENLRQGLSLADLDTSEVSVKFHALNSGAAMSADIILKKYDFAQQLGEPAQMRMTIRDSHDQSIRRDVRAMIYRLACLNGMLSTKDSLGISQKHTTFNDPSVTGRVAAQFPIRLEEDAKYMASLRNIKVERWNAIEFFGQTVAVYATKTGIKVNKKLWEEAVGIYDNYRDMGSSAYRVYNTLTHMATHVEAKRDGTEVERKRIRIEQDIENIIKGNEFKRLIGALEDVEVMA